MSFRRKPSRRQGPANPALASTEESVENPNAFGIFGHQYHAPAAVAVDENEHHGHSPQYATQWHSVPVHNPTHHDHHATQQNDSGGLQWHQHHSTDQSQSGGYLGPEGSEGHAPLVIPDGYQHPTASQTQLGLGPPLSSELHRQPSHTSVENAFELVHSAKDGHHLQEYGQDIPIHVRHLFKRPCQLLQSRKASAKCADIVFLLQ
jgi:hypothetical protein